MTVLIKTKHGAFVNLNNVFCIDYHIDDKDLGEIFAVSTPSRMHKEDGCIEMELFRGTETQIRKWMELFSKEIEYCTGVGVTVIDLNDKVL